mmetsp:Transcript_104474/g.248587  ORF Transcript_104474/g.248587 Transcript_104474/m.248587 type:complete len:259 (-) Transcript_104474:61-837(-)
MRLVDYLDAPQGLLVFAVGGHGAHGLHRLLTVGPVLEEDLLAAAILGGASPAVDLPILRARQTVKVQQHLHAMTTGEVEEAVEVGLVLFWCRDAVEVLELLLELWRRLWSLVARVGHEVPVAHRHPQHLHSHVLHVFKVGFLNGFIQPAQHMVLGACTLQVPQGGPRPELRDGLEEVPRDLDPILREETMAVVHTMPFLGMLQGLHFCRSQHLSQAPPPRLKLRAMPRRLPLHLQHGEVFILHTILSCESTSQHDKTK